jgi:arylsulfatase A-like enzyme
MLDERGVHEETRLVFTSDHGDLLGDHDLMVKGHVGYDPNVRVPLIARWPGMMDGGTRLKSPVQLNDLAALFCSAAGVEANLPDAVDPLPALCGEGAGRQHAICAYRNSGLACGHVPHDPPIHMTMATDGRWKLVLYHAGPGDAAPVNRQLFNLNDDPQELNDLVNQARGREALRGLTDVATQFIEEERQLAAIASATSRDADA